MTVENTKYRRLDRVLSAHKDAIKIMEHDEKACEKDSLMEHEEKERLTGITDENGRNDEENRTELEENKHCMNIQWNLVKFAAYYFFTGGAPAMLVSYLPVYYRQLGLDPQQIGVIQSLQPWISIPAIPLWGHLADRVNATRSILLFSLITYLISYLVLSWTPKVDEVDCDIVIARICKDTELQLRTSDVQSLQQVLTPYEEKNTNTQTTVSI